MKCIHVCVSGGGTIIPEAGVISGGVCTAMSPLTSGAHLELEVKKNDIKSIGK